jgi:predicted  nucleic acid-binding Zn-ribbon protein
MTLQEKLQHLFVLDSQVRGLRKSLDTATRRRNALQTKVEQLTRQQAEMTDQIKHYQAKASSLEHQAGDIEERSDRLRNKMAQVTSNKEYSALLIEVSTLKNSKGTLEDQALEELGHVDELQAQALQFATDLASQTQLLERASQEVEAHQQDVGQRLEELTGERDVAAQAVPLDTRSVFDRLASSYDGQALACVNEINRRAMEYGCDGCYMTIPIEVVNALYTLPEQATKCPHCGRLLYLGDALRATMGPKD